MTEPREPLRLHPTEARTSRVVGGGGPRGRRLDPVRLAAAILLAGATVWLGSLGARRGFLGVRDWLHDQPPYQLPFREITLDPPPPDWLRLGTAGVLEQVREGAGRPETLPLLDVNLAELAKDFQRESPWIRAVTGITRAYPNRLTVSLRYREPAALLRLGSGRRLVLDAESVVLPEDAVDLSLARPVVLLAVAAADEEGATLSARPGRVLQLLPSGAAPTEPARVPVALAAFFQNREIVVSAGTPMPSPPRPTVAAIQTDPQGRLWVELSGRLLVLWGRADGTRETGELDNAGKLDRLNAWFNDHPTSLPLRPRFLASDHDRVVVVQPRNPS